MASKIRSRLRSYKNTPFYQRIRANCLGNEKLLIQAIIRSKDPRKTLKKYANGLSSECRSVAEELVTWLS